MRMNRLMRSTIVLAAAALVLSGCAAGGGGDQGSGPSSDELGDSTGPYTPTGDEVSTEPDADLHALLPEDVVEAGVLNIAVDTLYPPMTYYDENKRLIGFDAELGRLIGQKLDIPVSLNHQNFDAVIPSLQAGKNDMIMEGMNDTKERQKTLSFVDYSKGGFLILVQKGNPAGITTKTDLCGKTVSIQKATVQGDLLKAMDCGVNVMELPSDVDAQTALRAGKSDAYVADAVVTEWVAATTEDGDTYDVVRDPENPAGFSPVYSGIGILKDRTELIEAVRSALQALMDEGAYQKALERSNIAPYALDSAQINQGEE